MEMVQEFVLANQFTEFAMADSDITPVKSIELTEQPLIGHTISSYKEEKVIYNFD